MICPVKITCSQTCSTIQQSTHAGKCGCLQINRHGRMHTHTPKQGVKLVFYPPSRLDSGAAATQPSWTDDSGPSSGIIPGKSDLVPPVSQEDTIVQILFRLLIIWNALLALAFFGCIRFLLQCCNTFSNICFSSCASPQCCSCKYRCIMCNWWCSRLHSCLWVQP